MCSLGGQISIGSHARSSREASMMRFTIALALALGAAACASAPPAPRISPPPPAPPSPPRLSFEEKMARILRLEDQRMLRDVVAPAPAPAPDSAPGPVTTPLPSAPPADLVALLADEEARTRRRAALAVGRVGLVDGVD